MVSYIIYAILSTWNSFIQLQSIYMAVSNTPRPIEMADYVLEELGKISAASIQQSQHLKTYGIEVFQANCISGCVYFPSQYHSFIYHTANAWWGGGGGGGGDSSYHSFTCRFETNSCAFYRADQHHNKYWPYTWNLMLLHFGDRIVSSALAAWFILPYFPSAFLFWNIK